MGCGGRGRDVALSPHHAHRHIDRARHDPDRSHDILGTDVLRDHGWIAGRDGADVDLPSGAVHCLVSGEAACRHGLSARSGYRSARLEISQHRETGSSREEVLERITAKDKIQMDRVVEELKWFGKILV